MLSTHPALVNHDPKLAQGRIYPDSAIVKNGSRVMEENSGSPDFWKLRHNYIKKAQRFFQKMPIDRS